MFRKTKSDEMEFSSPFTTNSSKLSAITDFLFLRKTSQALYNWMMKSKHATDPRNRIQMVASCSSGILKTMYQWRPNPGGASLGSEALISKTKQCPHPARPKNCQKCTIPHMFPGVPRGCPGGQLSGKPMISA